MRRTLAPMIGVSLLLSPGASFSAAPNQQECYSTLVEELREVHDDYRSVVFGSRRDPLGKFAVLTGGFTDAPRPGILETKGRLTSELVPPLVDAYQTYRCKSSTVCKLLEQSLTREKGPVTSVDIKILGCEEERDIDLYPSCFLGGTPGTNAADASDQHTPLRLLQQCQTLVSDTLKAEDSVLRLAVSYDAGYRSMIQHAGIMDWMLQGFPTETIRAVSDMVNMLGKLFQIPCFIGQCDHPDTRSISP